MNWEIIPPPPKAVSCICMYGRKPYKAPPSGMKNVGPTIQLIVAIR